MKLVRGVYGFVITFSGLGTLTSSNACKWTPKSTWQWALCSLIWTSSLKLCHVNTIITCRNNTAVFEENGSYVIFLRMYLLRRLQSLFACKAIFSSKLNGVLYTQLSESGKYCIMPTRWRWSIFFFFSLSDPLLHPVAIMYLFGLFCFL